MEIWVDLHHSNQVKKRRLMLVWKIIIVNKKNKLSQEDKKTRKLAAMHKAYTVQLTGAVEFTDWISA